LPDEVLEECARRYLASRMKIKVRVASRSREQYEKVKEESKATFAARVGRIVDQFAGELHEGWSATILAGEFSLPDGTRVTWGNATRAQHEARAAQLESQATGELETAAIHRSAIKDLSAADVGTLAELVS